MLPFSSEHCPPGFCLETILSVVLDGRETSSLELNEEYRLRRISGQKRIEEVGENYIMRSFITCTLLQV
jgi:hypothetical protein